MTETLILACDKCGGLLLAKADTRTRTCPYCGTTVRIDRARRVGSSPTAQAASTLLKKLKAPRQPEQKNG